jgi:hypothetical protein
MTDQELRDLIAGLAVRHAELAEIQKATERQIRATGRPIQETKRQVQETSRTVRELSEETDKELREQLRRLGDKFGGFTEGMALPSMRKLLEDRFDVDVTSIRTQAFKHDSVLELDVLAYSRSRIDEVYIVGVAEGRLEQEGLDHLKRNLREFHNYFTFSEFANRKVYGILAAVDIPESLRAKVLQEGIYLALIHDDEFELQVPDDFHPRAF